MVAILQPDPFTEWLQLFIIILFLGLAGVLAKNARKNQVSYWKLGMALICVVVAVGILFTPTGARIDRLFYHGKDQFYWSQELQSADPARKQEAIVALTSMIRSSKSSARYWVIQQLAECGPEAISAIPALAEVAHDPNEALVIRERALQAIDQINRDGQLQRPIHQR
jgi:hypothetical protein